MSNNIHLTTEQALDYLEGRLEPVAREEVLKHLSDGCPDCAQNLADLTRILQAIQATSWPSPSAQARQQAINAFYIQYPEKVKPQPVAFFRPVLIGLALIAVVFVILFLNLPQPVNAAILKEMTGSVDIKVNSSAAWQTLSLGQSIPVGSIIRTSSNGQAVLTYPGGSRSTLGPDTQLELAVLASTDGQWQITLTQTSGKTEVVSSVKTALFRIQTAAGSTDTNEEGDFDLQVEEDGTTVVSVKDGRVNANTSGGSLLISPGQTGLLRKDSAPITPTPEGNNQSPTSSSNQKGTNEPNGAGSNTPSAPNNPGNNQQNNQSQTTSQTPQGTQQPDGNNP